MPEYRRARTEGGTYFFTVVTYRRQPILCLRDSWETLSGSRKDILVGTAHPTVLTEESGLNDQS